MSRSSNEKISPTAFTWRGMLKWSFIAFFVVAGLLNVFATAPLLAEYRRWGYPSWMHYATGVLELSSAVLQARTTSNKVGVALGAAVMLAAALTLAIHREWLHAVFPALVLSP